MHAQQPTTPADLRVHGADVPQYIHVHAKYVRASLYGTDGRTDDERDFR